MPGFMPAIPACSPNCRPNWRDLRSQKDADEERWLALEMEREALEQAGGT